jgi:AcrR family transcriptional regulator
MSAFSLELTINEKLYLRDPQRSETGRRILRNSVLLLDEIGLERFTFKRLAERLSSTEATVYRYFESKHLLLLYLTNWYWEWMKVHIDYAVHNIESPTEKLRRAIKAVVDTAKRNTNVEFIDEDILHRIVITEGAKAYHSKEVDEQNRDGFFLSYKSLCRKLADIILEVNPQFPYPCALATNLLEMANNNIYFAQHLPRLTEVTRDDDILEQVEQLLEFFALTLVVKKEQPDEAPLPESLNGYKTEGAGLLNKYPAEPGHAPQNLLPHPQQGGPLQDKKSNR